MPAVFPRFSALPSVLLRSAGAGLLALASAWAGAQTAAAPAAPSAPARPAVAAATSPEWRELSPAQQAALRPLGASWAGLSTGQKRKWLSISQSFGSLPAAEQGKMHERMSEWATLSPQQRTQARLNFAETRAITDGLTPEQRQAQWQAYQLLSPEEKRRLASGSRGAPPGAAVAVKPAHPLKASPPPQFGTAQALSKLDSRHPLPPRRIAAPHPGHGPGPSQHALVPTPGGPAPELRP